ncbi:hypothetical protein GCM10028800_10280 [Nesterenkonia populi]
MLALFIDWGIASLISFAFFGFDELVTLGIFVLMHVLLGGLLGVTIGKRLMRIQVVRLGNGGPASIPGPAWSSLRTAMLLLIIPVLLISPDGRGAHDRIAGTVQLQM